MKLDPIAAQLLLLKCTGDEIWSVETCQAAGVPQIWIDELVDCFESGYDTDRNTIYIDDDLTEEKMVNQYEGSVCAEHGVGQLKRALLAHYADPVSLDLMRQNRVCLRELLPKLSRQGIFLHNYDDLSERQLKQVTQY